MWYSLIEIKQSAPAQISATVKTDENSPWFSGHFPGDPILPGIAQLGMVFDVISKVSPEDSAIKNLTRIKFKKIIRPGELLTITVISGRKKNSYSFRIMADGKEVCSGGVNLTDRQDLRSRQNK